MRGRPPKERTCPDAPETKLHITRPGPGKDGDGKGRGLKGDLLGISTLGGWFYGFQSLDGSVVRVRRIVQRVHWLLLCGIKDPGMQASLRDGCRV